MEKWFVERSEVLTHAIERYVKKDGMQETSIPGLRFIRASRNSERVHSVYTPSLCVIAQGAKLVMLGEESYNYDRNSYLTASVHLPIIGQVVEASPEQPYLSLQLQLDINEILEVFQSSEQIRRSGRHTERGLAVSRLSHSLLDAIIRLVRLLDTPQDIPVLAAGVIREIIYRLLQDEQNAALKQLALLGSQAQRISNVIVRLNGEFAQPLRVEELAEQARMSASSFYTYFKVVTGMSPIQYQKQLRLQEARRLLLTGDLKAADAAFRVGYESPSHFTREYTRKFGLSPGKDIRRLRETLGDSGALI